MSKRRTRLGLAGVRWAARALRAAGYTILARRWRIVGGAIDLIAREHGEYVFVEVKTRRGQRFGPPQLAVTPRKLGYIARAATQWLAQRVGDAPAAWRIDVVAVELGRDDLPAHHYFPAVRGLKMAVASFQMVDVSCQTPDGSIEMVTLGDFLLSILHSPCISPCAALTWLRSNIGSSLPP